VEDSLNLDGQRQNSSQWFETVNVLIALQVISGLLTALLLYLFTDIHGTWNIVLGALLVALNMWLMQRVFKKEDIRQQDIYLSAVLRYVMFIVVLLVFAWLGLNLLAVLGGMALAYVVSYVFSAYTLLRHRQGMTVD